MAQTAALRESVSGLTYGSSVVCICCICWQTGACSLWKDRILHFTAKFPCDNSLHSYINEQYQFLNITMNLFLFIASGCIFANELSYVLFIVHMLILASCCKWKIDCSEALILGTCGQIHKQDMHSHFWNPNWNPGLSHYSSPFRRDRQTEDEGRGKREEEAL